MTLRLTALLFILITGGLVACTKTETTPTADLITSPKVEMAEVIVYFLDESRFASGTEPYEIGVLRSIHPDAFLPRMALQAYFDRPTVEEAEKGLRAVLSSCTGFSEFSIQDGIAMVKLEGPCTSGGSTYTIAQPIIKTLLQFPEIQYVKIFDAAGTTEEPFGPVNSIPFVLEP
jgi:Fe-S cluster biogenesis protein NfuA